MHLVEFLTTCTTELRAACGHYSFACRGNTDGPWPVKGFSLWAIRINGLRTKPVWRLMTWMWTQSSWELPCLTHNDDHQNTNSGYSALSHRWRRTGHQYYRDGCGSRHGPGEAGYLRENSHRGRGGTQRWQVRYFRKFLLCRPNVK